MQMQSANEIQALAKVQTALLPLESVAAYAGKKITCRSMIYAQVCVLEITRATSCQTDLSTLPNEVHVV